MTEKVKNVGLGIIPPRIQEIMDRHELTGKITSKQRLKLNHHYLLQREFAWTEKRDARVKAKKEAEDDDDDDDDEEEEEEEEEEEQEEEEEES
mmetsp:Transcript_6139/g.7309  ORF Transcript_6139/g.7309 Transcript_6139/m.7309 type:complete len:93 (-) Transcript_6139:587-865(-)|eukprot:CAMPEP_0197340494 /NCGR_PEP_ID=MMETSP0892-20130614/45693_1 /TAXON_ID=44058 ORGANISM="Aureoumbra lagunensis, Strain CCMP1510" /NCGR_SAMPLE_ID=MMETSP0892 /ASSEMBLY_ACC=CAM_ASM_000538 /LENGTH=92 /DNA_ID=CAMNT_0042845245 /DNA_START=45 /DNA_END=323 /DNA_ORIENTATION=+